MFYSSESNWIGTVENFKSWELIFNFIKISWSQQVLSRCFCFSTIVSIVVSFRNNRKQNLWSVNHIARATYIFLHWYLFGFSTQLSTFRWNAWKKLSPDSTLSSSFSSASSSSSMSSSRTLQTFGLEKKSWNSFESSLLCPWTCLLFTISKVFKANFKSMQLIYSTTDFYWLFYFHKTMPISEVTTQIIQQAMTRS